MSARLFGGQGTDLTIPGSIFQYWMMMVTQLLTEVLQKYKGYTFLDCNGFGNEGLAYYWALMKMQNIWLAIWKRGFERLLF